MARTFEIYGEVAAEVGTNPCGDYELILETRFGLEELTVPRTGEVGAEVGALSEGDRIALEIEREGRARVVLGVRPAYIRGFPRRGRELGLAVRQTARELRWVASRSDWSTHQAPS